MVKYTIEPGDVKVWLEWAGSRLLCMKISSPKPGGYRNFWPDYQNDVAAYGYTKETMRAPAVGPKEIDIMDQILAFVPLVDDTRVRRIVHRRLLVTPVSGRYVHSFVKIAEEFHMDARLAARLYLKGLDQIGQRVPAQQAHRIRQFLALGQTRA